MPTSNYRVIYNCDSGEAFRRFPAPSSERQICMVLDELQGTAVDAFCYAATELVTMYPSKVREEFGSRLTAADCENLLTIGWELTAGQDTEHSHIRIHELEARLEPAGAGSRT